MTLGKVARSQWAVSAYFVGVNFRPHLFDRVSVAQDNCTLLMEVPDCDKACSPFEGSLSNALYGWLLVSFFLGHGCALSLEPMGS